MTDWNKLEYLESLAQYECVFDNPPDTVEGGMYNDVINPKILNGEFSDEVIEDVMFWKNMQRGKWITTGPAGSGKGVLLNMVAYKMKTYFGRTPILDYPPAKLFGYYEFINDEVFVNKLESMNEMIEGEIHAELKRTKGGETSSRLIEQASEEFLKTQGKTFFQHCVLVLDEYKRYRDKRHPHNPMNMLLSNIDVFWRHLDMLMLCATTDRTYLDARAFKDMSAEVRCTWLGNPFDVVYEMEAGGKTMEWEPMLSLSTLYPSKFIDNTEVIVQTGKPIILKVDAAEPREILDWDSYKHLYNTVNLQTIMPPKSLVKLRDRKIRERLEAVGGE